MVFSFFHFLHHIWLTYADLFTDTETKSDISDMDLYGHTLCDLFVVVFALFCIRFKNLRKYLMIVFYFFLCMAYVFVCYYERSSY